MSKPDNRSSFTKIMQDKKGRVAQSTKLAIGITVAFALFLTGLSSLNVEEGDRFQAQAINDFSGFNLGVDNLQATFELATPDPNAPIKAPGADEQPKNTQPVGELPREVIPNAPEPGAGVVGEVYGSSGVVESSSLPATCQDSDNAADKYSAGETRIFRGQLQEGSTSKDFCQIVNRETVYESNYLVTSHFATSYYCSGNQIASERVGCELGCNAAGTACVRSYDISCTSNDKGAIRTIKDGADGSVLEKAERKNSCVNGVLFTESCDGSKNLVSNSKVCDNGCNAEGTACKNALAGTCKDTDEANSIYVKGEVTLFDANGKPSTTKSDECRGTYGVTEYKCIAGDLQAITNMSCPLDNICSEGKCVPKPALDADLSKVSYSCQDFHTPGKDYSKEAAIVNVIKTSKILDDAGKPLSEERSTLKDRCYKSSTGKSYKIQYGCSAFGKPYTAQIINCKYSCSETSQGAVCSDTIVVSPTPKVYTTTPAPQVYNVSPTPKVYTTTPAPQVYNVSPTPKVYTTTPNPNTTININKIPVGSIVLDSTPDTRVNIDPNAVNASKPDLEIKFLGWGTNAEGKEFKADVHNVGKADLNTGVDIAVKFTVNGVEKTVVKTLTEPFKSGYWVPVVVSVPQFNLIGGQNFTATAMVDPNNIVSEANENNNTLKSAELKMPQFAYSWATDATVIASNQKITTTIATIDLIKKQMESGAGGVNGCVQRTSEIVRQYDILIAEYEALLDHANKQTNNTEALEAARDLGFTKLPNAREERAKMIKFCETNYSSSNPSPSASPKSSPVVKNTVTDEEAKNIWENNAEVIAQKTKVLSSVLDIYELTSRRVAAADINLCREEAEKEIRLWDISNQEFIKLAELTASKGVENKAEEIKKFIDTIPTEIRRVENYCEPKFTGSRPSASVATLEEVREMGGEDILRLGSDVAGSVDRAGSTGTYSQRISEINAAIQSRLPEYEARKTESKNANVSYNECGLAMERAIASSAELKLLFADLEKIYREYGNDKEADSAADFLKKLEADKADMMKFCENIKAKEAELTAAKEKELADAKKALEQAATSSTDATIKKALEEAQKKEAELAAAKKAAEDAKAAAEAALKQAQSEAAKKQAQEDAAKKQLEYDQKRLSSLLDQYEALLRKAQADVASSCAVNPSSSACKDAQTKEREIIVKVVNTGATKDTVEATSAQTTATTQEQKDEFELQLQRARNAQKASFRARGITPEEVKQIIQTYFPKEDYRVWYARNLAKFYKYGCIDAGDFKPASFITRSETAKLIACALEGTEYAQISQQNYPEVFNDVPKSEWYFNVVMYLFSKGYSQGYISNIPPFFREFRPSQFANRAESLALLTRSYGFTCKFPMSGQFSDVVSSDWFSACVNFGYQNNVVIGYDDGTFKPGNPINRAEFLKMLDRFDEILLEGYAPLGE